MKRDILLLIVCGVVITFVTKIFTLELPLVLTDLGFSFVEVSGLFTISILLFQIIKIVLAKISDYYGRKIFFRLSSIMAIITNVLPLIQLKYFVLLVANFFNSLSIDMWNMIYIPVVLDYLPKKNIAKTYNKWIVTPFIIGGICVILFLTVFRSLTFKMILTTNLVLLLIVTILMRWLKVKHKKPKGKSFSFKALFSVKHKNIKRLMVFNIFNGIRLSAGWIFLMPLLMKTVYEFDNSLIIVFIVSFEVLWGFFTFFSSKLNDIDHIKYPIMGMSLAVLVSILCFFYFHNPTLFLVLLILQSAGMSFTLSSIGKVMKHHIGEESARESNLVGIMQVIGQAIGFAIAGPIATIFSLQSLFLVRAFTIIVMVYIYAGFSKRLFREYFI